MLFERNVAIAEWRECRIARPPTDKEGDTPKPLFTFTGFVKEPLFLNQITYFTMKKSTLLFTYLLMTYCLTAQNQPPVAVNDTLTVIEGNKLLGEVILNDSDPENDRIFTALLTEIEGGIEVSNGVLEYFCANGAFCYRPDFDFVGTDIFTYVLTDSFGNMDTATVFLNVEAQDSITFGTALRRACVVTCHPCKAAFSNRIDPCTIPLSPSALARPAENISGFQPFSEWKNLIPTNDSCDFFALYNPPIFGTLYLTNMDSSNVTTDLDSSDVNLDNLFYYEPNPLFVGLTSDTFGLLKCSEDSEGIYCDSIEVTVTIMYDEPCDYTDIEKYCCVSTTSIFPCDVLANDLALLDSIFPVPEYTVSDLSISNILMSPGSGMVNINGTMDSLIYDADGFSGIDTLTYQTEFTVTDNTTGEVITLMSSPQTVFILVDDDCTLETQTIPTQLISVGDTLCVDPMNYVSVFSELFALCPDDIECTNDLLSNYDLILPEGAYIEDGIVKFPTDDNNCPPELTFTFCEIENSERCADVTYTIVYIEKIPTLSEWGLIILALLMLIIGMVAIKTEQQMTLGLSS